MTFINLIKAKTSKTSTDDLQFNVDLSRLSREAKNEMRMHNNEKQRFKKKYCKLDVYNEDPITEASEIRMYETHFPGFCYRSNGECRGPPVIMPNVFVDFQDIHALLFTNGEVDLEKVICLYVLSVHKTESLTPPPRHYNFFLPKKMFPIERLIERSKKKFPIDQLIELLPTYVLETDQTIDYTTSIDPRLASRLLINEKILEIVHTVLASLRQSNTHKFNNFIKTSKNEKVLKNILLTSKIEKYIKYLKGLQLITNCEAFQLSGPTKNEIRDLQVKTKSGQLEDLVRHIRKNMFQMPEALKRSELFATTKMKNETMKENNLEVYSNEDLSLEYELSSQKLNVQENEYGLEMNKSLENFCCEDDTIVNRSYELRINRREKAKLNIPFGKENLELNKIKEGDSLTFLAMPGTSSYDSQKDKEMCEIDEDTDFLKVAVMLNNKVKELTKRDRKSSKFCYCPHDEIVNIEPPQLPAKLNNKLLRCTACQSKWKDPYPQPKVSDVIKVYIPKLDEESYNEIKTDSLHKISKMIDRKFIRSNEEKNLSGVITSTVINKNARQSNFVKTCHTEVVQLKDLDLALIRQEIKEKEAQKKYTNFFKRSLKYFPDI